MTAPVYEYLINTIVEHPIIFGFVALVVLAVLEQVKNIVLCIVTKGASETKKQGKDDVLEPDYIIIDTDKKEK